ncbi:cysteine desulfurase family protein [Propionivibrio limicola]|uniref:cysteine desulfurase family protein n=1 Tax=Propionivibrio limicola TaxID=167645 RepID=UPI001B863915|nr:cysteine desulfurase family protein [Propionivibrio limicola]
MQLPVYFDHNATTPIDHAVLEAMLPWLDTRFGNPSSRHEYGRAARRAVDEARAQVAEAVGAHATEVVFTSGGSEANNLFIKGAAACLAPGVLAVSAIEHPCVLNPARQLVKRGWNLQMLPVDEEGRVDPARFARLLEQKPKLISVMLANNETGVLQDVIGLADLAASMPGGARAWFHSDAVQALGKMPLDFRALNARGVHALTLSAHKIGGPKGAGALVLDKRVEIEPLIAGGGHERGLRSGTENVAAIVGFATACALAVRRREKMATELALLRDRLEAGLREIGATVFGDRAPRLPNTIYFALPNLDGETLVTQLDRSGFAVASGAACSSANPEPSHVLQAMSVGAGLARGAVRISLGPGNTAKQVDEFLLVVKSLVSKLLSLTAIAV